MTKPKRHHIVPRCYLASFTNRKNSVFVLPKDGRDIFETGTRDIAVRNHYYSFINDEGERDVTLEEYFGDLEGTTKTILNKIQQQAEITMEDKEYLAIFLGLMYSRNPNFRDGVEQNLAAHIDTIKDLVIDNNKEMAEHFETVPEDLVQAAGGKEHLKDYLKANLKPQISPEASLKYIQTGLKISEQLMYMHWRFWINTNRKSPFFSSDNPCYMTTRVAEKIAYGAGIGWPDSKLYFPISPTVFLVADWIGKLIDYKPIKNTAQTSRFNARTVRHAEKEVYSPICNKKIIKLYKKNKGYSFTTLIDKVDSSLPSGKNGTYQLSRRKLVKSQKD